MGHQKNHEIRQKWVPNLLVKTKEDSKSSGVNKYGPRNARVGRMGISSKQDHHDSNHLRASGSYDSSAQSEKFSESVQKDNARSQDTQVLLVNEYEKRMFNSERGVATFSTKTKFAQDFTIRVINEKFSSQGITARGPRSEPRPNLHV